MPKFSRIPGLFLELSGLFLSLISKAPLRLMPPGSHVWPGQPGPPVLSSLGPHSSSPTAAAHFLLGSGSGLSWQSTLCSGTVLKLREQAAMSPTPRVWPRVSLRGGRVLREGLPAPPKNPATKKCTAAAQKCVLSAPCNRQVD